MTSRMTPGEIKKITEVVNQLQEPSWKSLIAELKDRGIFYSRQSLSAKTEIKMALRLRKEALKKVAASAGMPSVSKAESVSRIVKLTEEIEILKQQNSQLYELLLTWQYNAEMRGVTEDQLNQPLPHIKRA
ncbi:hypothetical protein EZI54_22255 [Marinobacter halodurans]|uniref:Uncharacterized protein n=1 Tax=Marinobacter halodurans TaxID=2528979 RepID=A0ABY1ZHW7_9GAMM|nr:hypothetical protein [Marinobacter halodurans]TBW47755.1 hypothetical protein EZI54_22255 [Marinobacter halodurans]